MIDHETARQSFATSLDFPLDAAERDALDEHLAGCASCRAEVAAIRADAAVLRDLDFGPVPIAVRANVAIAAEHREGRGAIGRWIALVGVAALLIVALGGGVLGVGGRPTGTAGPDPEVPDTRPVQIAWKTEVVTLTARDFSIDVRGKTFRAATPKVDIHSDPGDATYRTLEAIWQENGVEMRMNLYFSGDASASWVDEIRIYDAEVQGDWLTARGPFFKTPIGDAWSGDQDITVPDSKGQPARIHFGGLTLVSRAFDGVNEPAGGGIALPENAAPFAAGGALHCSGILQMAPKRAEATLLALGYRLSWRLVQTTGPNTGFGEVRKTAPDGIINADGLPGSSGELIMFVAPFGDEQANPVPFPPDCPKADPNLTPPPPTR